MSNRGRSWFPQSIGPRLTGWFLVSALVPTIALTVLMFRLGAESLAESARDHLRTVADAKSNQLESYAGERIRMAATMARTPMFVDAAHKLEEMPRNAGRLSPELQAGREAYRRLFAGIAESLGHPDLLIFSTNGDVLFQLRNDLNIGVNLRTGPLRATPLATSFENACTLLMPEIATFATYPGNNEPWAFVVSPLLGTNLELAGVLALRIDNQQIIRVIRDKSGLGRTGEPMVASLDADGRTISVISPERLKGGMGLAATQSIPIDGSRNDPLQRAVRADRGAGDWTDNRGRSFLATWGYLPSFQWGLVVKQDADEAFALINRQRSVMFALLGVTTLGVLILAHMLSLTLSRPIRRAAQLARQVTAGDLTGHVDLDAPGEPGQLLDALRAMNEQLRDLIGQTRDSASNLLSMATRLASAAEQQEHTIRDHSTATIEVSAAALEISGTSRELLQIIRRVDELSSETGQAAAASRQDLNEVDQALRRVVQSTADVDTQLSEISQRAETIDLAVETITKVADETNLLSINAAIEAEKAGEAGRGFLVVAREIRRLSDQTAIATLEIERIIGAMRQSLAQGLTRMRCHDEDVRQVVGDAGRVSERMAKILDVMRVLTPEIRQVAEGMAAQTDGAEQIREAIAHVSQGISQSANSLRELRDVSAQLQQSASCLQNDIARFVLP